MYVFMYVCVCMYVCIYVCMYVCCMYVCMHQMCSNFLAGGMIRSANRYKGWMKLQYLAFVVDMSFLEGSLTSSMANGLLIVMNFIV